jgi:hypothetical protein
METPVERSADFERVRRRVAHELYHKRAILSAVIWTVGTLLLFITYAAGNSRPIPMAGMAMTVPLLPAALPWLLYRPLTRYLAARRMRQSKGSEASGSDDARRARPELASPP